MVSSLNLQRICSLDYIRRHHAPAVTLYSGKITTWRQLSAEAIDQLKPVFPDLPASRTKSTPLPGAQYHDMPFATYVNHARDKYHWLDRETLERYLGNYGTRTELILQGCHKRADLGQCFADTLYQVEVDYLIREEWARSCEDVLWRRTKLGLAMEAVNQKKLAQYIARASSTVDQPSRHR